MLDLDVVLAGQDPDGLAQAVAAVSTPGSPDYRHYLSAAQYAAQYGPSAAEVAQVSSALRGEGPDGGRARAGEHAAPGQRHGVGGLGRVGTPLESVQAPGDAARAIVNTASPQIPSSLEGVVTGVVGLDGLVKEQAMIKQGHPGSAGSAGSRGAGSGPSESPEAQQPAPAPGAAGRTPAAIAHVGTPQACAGAQGTAFGGTYTSTQLASIFGLDQVLGQGRTGIGQSIAIVEFEQYAASDFAAFQACYGLSNPIRNVSVDGGAGGLAQGASGEAALDTEMAAVNAPSASLVVYEAPNGDDTQAFDLFNRIASDDSSQVVTTSWGVCEAACSRPTSRPRTGSSSAWPCRDRPSSRRRATPAPRTACRPTARPRWLSTTRVTARRDQCGGTSMASASASSQSVWNDCQGTSPACARNTSLGAGGGGYSLEWPANPGQPAGPGRHHPVPARPAGRCRTSRIRPTPDAGGVAAYWNGHWTGFGGTSVAAPTNAGLFVDTNQGCFSRSAASAPRSMQRNRATPGPSPTSPPGNNDFTETNSATSSPPAPASMRPAASAHPSTRP